MYVELPRAPQPIQSVRARLLHEFLRHGNIHFTALPLLNSYVRDPSACFIDERAPADTCTYCTCASVAAGAKPTTLSVALYSQSPISTPHQKVPLAP